MGNRCLSFLVNRLCRSKFTDLCYGYNAFWAANCLPVLDLDWTSPPPDDGDGRLWGDGFEIERSSTYALRRPASRLSRYLATSCRDSMGSNLNAPKDGLRVLRTIISEARRARRIRRADSASACPMHVATPREPPRRRSSTATRV